MLQSQMLGCFPPQISPLCDMNIFQSVLQIAITALNNEMRREDDDRIFAVENVPTLYPRAYLQSYPLVFIIGRPADAVDVALFLVPVAALLLTPTAQPALQPPRLLLRQIHASTVEPQTTRVARDVESEIEFSWLND